MARFLLPICAVTPYDGNFLPCFKRRRRRRAPPPKSAPLHSTSSRKRHRDPSPVRSTLPAAARCWRLVCRVLLPASTRARAQAKKTSVLANPASSRRSHRRRLPGHNEGTAWTRAVGWIHAAAASRHSRQQSTPADHCCCCGASRRAQTRRRRREPSRHRLPTPRATQ